VRLPRLRLTLRQLMALVAVAGVLLGAGVWAWKLKALRDRYKFQLFICSIRAQMEMSQMKMESSNLELRRTVRQLGDLTRGTRFPEGAEVPSPTDEEVDQADRRENARKQRVIHWIRLAEKYRSAADRPWGTVGPDPVEPPLPPRVEADRPPRETEPATQRSPRSGRRRVYD